MRKRLREKLEKRRSVGHFAILKNRRVHYLNGDIKRQLLRWARWLQKHRRHIGNTFVGPVRISTIFLGVQHGMFRPQWFETMVFDPEGECEECYRYATLRQARKGHARAVRMVEERYYEETPQEKGQ